MHPVPGALAAFFRAGLRPRTPLARAIATMLAIKLCIVIAARLFVFGEDARPQIDDAAVVRQLIVSAPLPQTLKEP